MSATPQGVAVGSLVLDEKVDGSGDLLLARQPGLGRRVLVKSLRRESLADPQRVERFRREARMAARVSHPNVQQAFDLFAWQGDHYLVLEHVEGASLRQWLDRLGPPPPEVARCLILELARGVEALHAAGIIHADLRPENAQVGRWGEVKLGALGCARSASEREVPAADVSACSAPEVAAGAAPDTRSDVYSLAFLSAELAGARRLTRALHRARRADPQSRPTAAALRASLERALEDASPAAVRARIATWLVTAREATESVPAPPGPRGVWLSNVARRAALAGVGTGVIAALLVGWDRGVQPIPDKPAVPAAAEPAAAPPVPDPPSVDAGAAAAPAPTPEPAHVRFAVFPWGEIRVDGGEAILTPRAEPIALAPGSHRIEIAHPTLGTERREISLAAGERRTLRHVFDRTPAP